MGFWKTMKRFHKASAEVFTGTNENISFLDIILPISSQKFFDQQFYYDPDHENTKIYELHKAKAKIQRAQGFDSEIIIYDFSFEKITDTNQLFDEIIKNFTKEDHDLLAQEALLHTDQKGNFCFKLGLNELRAGNFCLVDKGPCVQMTFLIAAYPKSSRTIRTAVKELFRQTYNS